MIPPKSKLFEEFFCLIYSFLLLLTKLNSVIIKKSRRRWEVGGRRRWEVGGRRRWEVGCRMRWEVEGGR